MTQIKRFTQPKCGLGFLTWLSLPSLAMGWSAPLPAQTLEELKQQLEQQSQVLQELKQQIERLEKQSEKPKPAVTSGTFDKSIKLPNSETSVSWGGYVKLDAIYTDYGSSLQVGDDTLVPPLIPLKGTAADRKGDLNIHAKESRVWFKTMTPSELGPLGTFVEMDFLNSDQGNERFSNSYSPRLRHAYANIGNWLFGQTWSTFMNLDSKAETLDFTGSVSEIFMRQPQLRYTYPWEGGNMQIALENPETTLTDVKGQRLIPGVDRWPEIVGRVNFQGEIFSTAVAVLARHLRTHGTYGAVFAEEEQWGLAVTASGNIKTVGQDNFKWQLNYGDIGRYMVANSVNDGRLSLTGEMDTIQLAGVHLAYQHWWSPTLRSHWLAGYAQTEEDFQASDSVANQRLWSSHLNLIWSPTPFSKFGIEYLHAYREVENGQEGAINRVQMSGRYDF